MAADVCEAGVGELESVESKKARRLKWLRAKFVARDRVAVFASGHHNF